MKEMIKKQNETNENYYKTLDKAIIKKQVIHLIKKCQ